MTCPVKSVIQLSSPNNVSDFLKDYEIYPHRNKGNGKTFSFKIDFSLQSLQFSSFKNVKATVIYVSLLSEKSWNHLY